MVYVFDTWLKYSREALKPLGLGVCLQYHDEILLYCKKELKEQVQKILKDAMEKVNKEMGLNISIGIDTQDGVNYAECH